MKPILFRFKIAFLSLLVSGLLVVSFGLLFLVTIGRVGITRIDNEIRSLGEVQVRVSRPAAHWADFGQSLRFIYGEQPTQRFAVRVLDAAGVLLFSSEQWPAELSDIDVPELQIPPEDPGRRRRAAVRPAMAAPGAGFFRDGPDHQGGRLVQRLDRDGDRRVSAAEFDGPADHFRALDQNGDGYVVLSEVLQVSDGPPHAMAGAPGGGPGLPARAPREPRGPAPMEPARPKPKVPVFETHDTSAGAWRVGFMGSDTVNLIVAADLSAFQRETMLFRNAFLVVTPMALLILGWVGWVLASRAMRPVAIITRTAEAITARDLHRRIPPMSADVEHQRLVDVINRMLERLERSFNQAARFSADAAHELQTPLTVLQGELDNGVQESVAGSEEQQRYTGLLEEVSGLKAVVQKLLLLARADVGELSLSHDDVDLSELIQSAIEDVETVAPQLTVEANVPPEVHVQADGSLIGQVLRNMTSNAVKYAQENGIVRFDLSVSDASIRFTLSNTADPIPEADREKLFNRFHRVDRARSRDARGSGLGLSLAREIAHAHGGDLVLDPSHGDMVSFTLSLPRT